MKNLFQSNTLFLFIVLLVCGFLTLKTFTEYNNLTKIEAKIHYQASVMLKQFLISHRETYQRFFVENHIPITDTTIKLLPAVAIAENSKNVQETTGSKIQVKTVTDRPRNPKNRADSIEMEAMQFFRSHPADKEYYKPITAGKDEFFFYSSPLYINALCLKCHGSQDEVIPSVAEQYDTAYDYKKDELRGIISIKIARHALKEELTRQFFIKTTLTTIAGSCLFLLIIFFLIRKVKRDEEQYTRRLELTVQQKTGELQEQVNLLQEYSKILDASAIVSKGDLQGRITYVNDKMCALSGYSKEELIGQPHSILRHSDMKDSVLRHVRYTIQNKKIWQGLIHNRNKDGSSHWFQATVCPVLDHNGSILEFITARNNVTELVKKRQELQALLTTDSLTGLANRYQLLQDLAGMERATVILLDILSFSDINDFFGTENGDLILAEFAHRVAQAFPDKPWQTYKLHGDQVALLLKGEHQEAELEILVRQLIGHISSTPFYINNDEIVVHMTCGVAWDLANAQLEADIALKQAKNNRQDFVINKESSNIKQEMEKNHNCALNIKNALRSDRVVTFFQPIVAAATGKVDKYECLVRIIEEDGRVISPYLFLKTAKKARIYTKITKVVIDSACRNFRNTDLDFSINLSTEDIMNPAVVAHLKEKLTESSLTDRAIIEILETEGFDNYEQVCTFVRDIKEMGCRIAIDDFGTGHSNYERLLSLQVDYLKIDGSIIKKITTDEVSKTIVETIVAVARKLDIQTVAEFVFDKETAELATSLGVDYLQGYYFSEPLTEIPRTGE